MDPFLFAHYWFSSGDMGPLLAKLLLAGRLTYETLGLYLTDDKTKKPSLVHLWKMLTSDGKLRHSEITGAELRELFIANVEARVDLHIIPIQEMLAGYERVFQAGDFVRL
jgi:hypothetical protein